MRGASVLAGVVVAVGIAVSGCGQDNVAGTATSGDSPNASTPAARKTSERPPTSARKTSARPAPADPGDITTPGTELKVGDTAVVPFKKGGQSGHTVAITVSSIEKGDQAAFEQQFGERAKGLVPYYLKITVRNVGDSDLSHASAPRVRAIKADGRLTGVSLVGSLSGCESESFPKDAGNGATVESCVLQAARQADTVAGAQYAESEGGYSSKPIVWKS